MFFDDDMSVPSTAPMGDDEEDTDTDLGLEDDMAEGEDEEIV